MVSIPQRCPTIWPSIERTRLCLTQAEAGSKNRLARASAQILGDTLQGALKVRWAAEKVTNPCGGLFWMVETTRATSRQTLAARFSPD